MFNEAASRPGTRVQCLSTLRFDIGRDLRILGCSFSTEAGYHHQAERRLTMAWCCLCMAPFMQLSVQALVR